MEYKSECISGLLCLTDLFVFMPLLYCLNYYSKILKKGSIFFIRIILGILGPLDFILVLETASQFLQNACWDFD